MHKNTEQSLYEHNFWYMIVTLDICASATGDVQAMTINSFYKTGFQFDMLSVLLFINHCVIRLHYTHAMRV